MERPINEEGVDTLTDFDDYDDQMLVQYAREGDREAFGEQMRTFAHYLDLQMRRVADCPLSVDHVVLLLSDMARAGVSSQHTCQLRRRLFERERRRGQAPSSMRTLSDLP